MESPPWPAPGRDLVTAMRFERPKERPRAPAPLGTIAQVRLSRPGNGMNARNPGSPLRGRGGHFKGEGLLR